MIADFSKCRIEHPGGVVNKGRFVFYNGRAAVWTNDTRLKTSTRVLFADGAIFTKAPTAQIPHLVTLADGTEWKISQVGGGCGCGTAIKSLGAMELTEPELERVG